MGLSSRDVDGDESGGYRVEARIEQYPPSSPQALRSSMDDSSTERLLSRDTESGDAGGDDVEVSGEDK